MWLWPKEHGAYGQMAFPLLTAIAGFGIAPASVLAILAIVAAFLAHEPLLVLLGRRGHEVRRQQSRRAAAGLTVLGAAASGAALAALWIAPDGARWAFAVPLVPAAILAHGIATGREKSWQAEVCVALAFSLAAVPVARSAGATPAAAWSIASPFALLFVTSTLAVRVVILKVRGGGDPRAMAATRRAVFSVAIVGGAGLVAAAVLSRVSWGAVVAAAPGLVMSSVLALSPPRASRLKRVGWTLVGVSAAAGAILVVWHRAG